MTQSPNYILISIILSLLLFSLSELGSYIIMIIIAYYLKAVTIIVDPWCHIFSFICYLILASCLSFIYYKKFGNKQK